MAFYEVSPAEGSRAKLVRTVELICFALVVAHLVYLTTAYLEHIWLVAPDGNGLPTDFVDVSAAGKLVTRRSRRGGLRLANSQARRGECGRPCVRRLFGWHYPPTFMFIAAALALLPYTIANAVWVFGTFPAYVVAIRAIIGDRIGLLLAVAFPAVLANFLVGQNGFLSAGLIGGTLILLDRRPIMAGVLLGLLTYKPHLGLMFPIALAASGHWRVFVTAMIVAALMALASLLAFGAESWQAFFANISHTSHVFLSEGQADLSKLQTAFGLTRTLGGSEALAWAVQIVLGLAAAGVIAVLWRSRAADEIKCAALGIATMLATPYLYTYDLVVLAVPLAFLIRLGGKRGFLPQKVWVSACPAPWC